MKLRLTLFLRFKFRPGGSVQVDPNIWVKYLLAPDKPRHGFRPTAG